MSINIDSFMAFCKTLQGQTFTTAGERATFMLLSVTDDKLRYLLSSGETISTHGKYIVALLEHYDKTKSLRPGHYTHITFSSSYTLRLVRLYLERTS